MARVPVSSAAQRRRPLDAKAIAAPDPTTTYFQEVDSTPSTPIITADNVLIFGAGAGVELAVVQNYQKDLKLILELQAVEPNRSASFTVRDTESAPTASLVQRIRLDSNALVNLANGLRAHIQQHVPELIELLAKN